MKTDPTPLPSTLIVRPSKNDLATASPKSDLDPEGDEALAEILSEYEEKEQKDHDSPH